MTKEEFINKYNSSKTIEESLSKSISSSVQHNKLYKSTLISNNIKKQVRDFWSSKLILIKEKYFKPFDKLRSVCLVTIQKYESLT